MLLVVALVTKKKAGKRYLLIFVQFPYKIKAKVFAIYFED